MRILLFAVFIFCAASARASGSAVDRFMERLGGNIPFPPQEIVKALTAQGIPPSGMAVIPHGRSLERRSTDYEQPRSMMAFDLDPSDPYKPENFIFVAYTPRLRQLEIIGISKELPNDFMLVSEYTAQNKKARPLAPKQGAGLCLACHQNGGPIFPERDPGWFETNIHQGNFNEMIRRPNLDPFAKWILGEAFGAGTVALFDASVRIAGDAQCKNSGNACPGNSQRPSGFLRNRDSHNGHEHVIQAGEGHDPIIPRLSDSGLDTFLNPAPEWTIPLARDGTESFPSESPSKLFAKYCAGCHAGTDSASPPLPLADMTALGNYEGVAGRTVRGLLEAKIMPPISSAMPSPEDRKRMLDALATRK